MDTLTFYYAYIGAWKWAYPETVARASPGVQEQAAFQGAEGAVDAELGNESDPAWRADLDQLIFRGSRFKEEVAFFYRKTRTLIFADLIENVEPAKVGGA